MNLRNDMKFLLFMLACAAVAPFVLIAMLVNPKAFEDGPEDR